MDFSGWTPLMYAAHYGHYAVIRQLLNAGANPSTYHPQTGRTALMLAASNGHTRCVEHLVAGGANRQQLDFDGNNAVYFAIHNGHGGNQLLGEILGFKTPQKRKSVSVTPMATSERRRLFAAVTPNPPPNLVVGRPLTGRRLLSPNPTIN